MESGLLGMVGLCLGRVKDGEGLLGLLGFYLEINQSEPITVAIIGISPKSTIMD